MAISPVSDSNYQLNDGFSSSLSFAYDATGATSLTFCGHQDLSRTVSSVTYNSTALTQLWELATLDATGYSSYGYMMLSPATGSNTLAVTYSAACGAGGVAAGWSGVEGGSGVAGAHRTVYTNRNSTGTPTVTAVDSQSGDVVVGHALVQQTAITEDGAQTSLGQTDNSFSGGSSSDNSYKSASGASTALSWTATSGYWSCGATALIPAGAAGTKAPPFSPTPMAALLTR